MAQYTVLLTVVEHGTRVHSASLVCVMDLPDPAAVRDVVATYLEDLTVATRKHVPDEAP